MNDGVDGGGEVVRVRNERERNSCRRGGLIYQFEHARAILFRAGQFCPKRFTHYEAHFEVLPLNRPHFDLITVL